MAKRKVLFVDPPSGWKYGFPREFEGVRGGSEEYEAFLRQWHYPEKDIAFALNNSWWWEEEIDEEETNG